VIQISHHYQDLVHVDQYTLSGQANQGIHHLPLKYISNQWYQTIELFQNGILEPHNCSMNRHKYDYNKLNQVQHADNILLEKKHYFLLRQIIIVF
jgi:hypothetical protein